MHLGHLLLSLAAVPVAWSASAEATVHLGSTKGTPEYLASGVLDGVPPRYPNQIAGHWFTDIKLQWCRSGSGALSTYEASQGIGWTFGLQSYRNKLLATLNEYKTCRASGAKFVLIVNDLYGANTTTGYPGDNGNWTSYDAFIQQLSQDLVTYKATDEMVWEIWNEPDETYTWPRSTQQWIDMYVRTHKYLRSSSSPIQSMPIDGPTLASLPDPSSIWWTAWLQQIAGNNTIPDYYTYHMLHSNYTANDLQLTNGTLTSLLKQYNLPSRTVNINEYATKTDQCPSGYIWWISRLERYETLGLLANYQPFPNLYDLLANLLTKTDNPNNVNSTAYAKAPGYPVYQYYTNNMTGSRLVTDGDPHIQMDAYATQDSSTVRVLASARQLVGFYAVKLQSMSSIGYPTSGTASIRSFKFLGSQDHTVVASLPQDLGTQSISYTDNNLYIGFNQTDKTYGFAFEIAVRK